jgi:hypothetical protein
VRDDYDFDPDFGLVVDDGGPIDPGDTLADPERDTRLRLWDDEVNSDDRREDE